jgi:hypothetical protein
MFSEQSLRKQHQQRQTIETTATKGLILQKLIRAMITHAPATTELTSA